MRMCARGHEPFHVTALPKSNFSKYLPVANPYEAGVGRGKFFKYLLPATAIILTAFAASGCEIKLSQKGIMRYTQEVGHLTQLANSLQVKCDSLRAADLRLTCEIDSIYPKEVMLNETQLGLMKVLENLDFEQSVKLKSASSAAFNGKPQQHNSIIAKTAKQKTDIISKRTGVIQQMDSLSAKKEHLLRQLNDNQWTISLDSTYMCSVKYNRDVYKTEAKNGTRHWEFLDIMVAWFAVYFSWALLLFIKDEVKNFSNRHRKYL